MTRIHNGAGEYLARRPFNVLDPGGSIVIGIDIAWTSDASAAWDAAEVLTNKARARGLVDQIKQTGVVPQFDPPLDVEALPDAPRRAQPPTAPVVREARHETPEGATWRVAEQARVAAEEQAKAEAQAVESEAGTGTDT